MKDRIYCNYCGKESKGGILYTFGFYKICNKCLNKESKNKNARRFKSPKMKSNKPKQEIEVGDIVTDCDGVYVISTQESADTFNRSKNRFLRVIGKTNEAIAEKYIEKELLASSLEQSERIHDKQMKSVLSDSERQIAELKKYNAQLKAAMLTPNIDITGAALVEVKVRNDGTVLWVNTETGNALRICQIKKIEIFDERDKK
jgi:hypothetical protein